MTRPAMPKVKRAPKVWWVAMCDGDDGSAVCMRSREGANTIAAMWKAKGRVVRVTETAPPVKRRAKKGRRS